MQRKGVAPLAGAWIEIKVSEETVTESYVAPLAGAWIEINLSSDGLLIVMSLPLRERGLKFLSQRSNLHLFCRSPRGSVD